MRNASPELTALLASGSFAVADIYTVTLVGGTVLRWTAADLDVTVDGQTFLSSSSGAPRLERGKMRAVLGLENDTLEVTAYADDDVTVNGTPFLQFCQAGGFDGATLDLSRAFLPQWTQEVTGTLLWFSGRMAEIECSRSKAAITVKSWLELLNVKLPRNLYQPGCLHALYDSGCTLNKDDFAVVGEVASGATQSVIPTDLDEADGYFDLGYVVFSSGVASGLKRTIKSYADGALTLVQPLPEAPASGDDFTVYPGCDKKQATCLNKFNNLANFRGTPYVPVAETAR